MAGLLLSRVSLAAMAHGNSFTCCWRVNQIAHVGHSEITTGLDAFNDDGRERAVQKPKMEVVLRKAESFDQVMAQQTRPSPVTSSNPPVTVQAQPA